MAWNLCILDGTGMLAEYLPRDGAQRFPGRAPAYIAGSLAPRGKATPVEGGYRDTGSGNSLAGPRRRTGSRRRAR